MNDYNVNSNEKDNEDYDKNVYLIRSKELDPKEILIVLKNFDPLVHRHTCVQKTTCCHIVAVKIHNGESVEQLKSGNISAAVFEKNDRKKMARKMKGHIKNSQATKTLCSVNVETGSFINAD